jgi:polynucleotide 5'-hydroxyl-kinase GRC3/NOL9
MRCPLHWQPAIGKIIESPGTVMVAGEGDVGKTAFCLFLANAGAQAGLKVAVVDADVGQSHIGPPAAIGLGIMGKPLPELSAVPAEALYFIGSHSPAGHFSRIAVGVAKMVARARHKKLPLIVVDSCGLVKGKFAWRLTRGMMEMVGPDCMVLLTRVVNLESLAQLCRGREDLTCHQLKSAPGIRRKSTARRRKLREQAWKSYLQGGARREFSLDGVTVEGIPAGQGEGDWSGQIVGLHDGLGECLGLGLVSRLDWPTSQLEVLTPVEGRQKVKRVIFGMQRMKVHAKSSR